MQRSPPVGAGATPGNAPALSYTPRGVQMLLSGIWIDLGRWMPGLARSRPANNRTGGRAMPADDDAFGRCDTGGGGARGATDDDDMSSLTSATSAREMLLSWAPNTWLVSGEDCDEPGRLVFEQKDVVTVDARAVRRVHVNVVAGAVLCWEFSVDGVGQDIGFQLRRPMRGGDGGGGDVAATATGSTPAGDRAWLREQESSTEVPWSGMKLPGAAESGGAAAVAPGTLAPRLAAAASLIASVATRGLVGAVRGAGGPAAPRYGGGVGELVRGKWRSAADCRVTVVLDNGYSLKRPKTVRLDVKMLMEDEAIEQRHEEMKPLEVRMAKLQEAAAEYMARVMENQVVEWKVGRREVLRRRAAKAGAAGGAEEDSTASSVSTLGELAASAPMTAEEAADPLDWGEYEVFLEECFPENIKHDENGRVIWFDKRVVGEWRAVFNRMSADDALHELGPPPGSEMMMMDPSDGAPM